MKTISLLTMLVVAAVMPVLAQGDAALRKGDTFELKIGGVPADEATTISQMYTIDGEGYVNLAYIGKVQAANRTSSQIQSAIESAYKNQGYFTHPSITLNIPTSQRFVNVGGAVKAPGRIAYTADMTVFSAIVAAGDFNEFAGQNKVRLIRGNSVVLVDCKKVRRDPSLDVKVLPGDTIQVPESIL